MVDFSYTEYSDGRAVADNKNATVTVIARGNPVKPITLAKAGRITQLSALAFWRDPVISARNRVTKAA